ncbi:hypothetical protein [Qipengyuania qiaonensis]|uniref:Secreted protein n=1 Tax=Qipengyuania qiaonensis TaxID=2867240 RepID=A0ABS7J0W0_9SPHN|nr:hypothetical protein [Qipengyuania qiaonensis]MBX7480986.1 hypothetical protein [Qipengyuania qiaonensis]
MFLLSPFAAMLIALVTPQGAGSDMDAHQAHGPESTGVDLDSLSTRSSAWTGFTDSRSVPIAHQVTIERRVILRISPQSSAMRRSMLGELPQQALPRRFVERPHGKCLDAGDIVGVSDHGSRLVMYMRDRQIVSAKLEKACSPRDFYLGFYVERNDDGKLCVDRDRLMSRAGARCRISKLNRLVAFEGEP